MITCFACVRILFHTGPDGHRHRSRPAPYMTNDLEQRLIPKVLQLVCSPEEHHPYLGNWTMLQLDKLSKVLLNTDTAAAI